MNNIFSKSINDFLSLKVSLVEQINNDRENLASMICYIDAFAKVYAKFDANTYKNYSDDIDIEVTRELANHIYIALSGFRDSREHLLSALSLLNIENKRLNPNCEDD